MFTLVCPHQHNNGAKDMKAVKQYDMLKSEQHDFENQKDSLKSVRSAWIADPFELGGVKGLTNFNHSRNLTNYAEELVSHYAKYIDDSFILFLSDLPDDEQNQLARLYLESTDRDTGECVHGEIIAIDNSYTCALLSMLQDDSEETREKFARVTRKNIIIYYQRALQEVLDDACNAHIHNINNEHGYYAQQCSNTGEIHWGRF